MTGILGSGFGLYGYLPAVVRGGDEVCLLTKSREKVAARSELYEFAHNVTYVDTVDQLLKQIDTLILSVPPYAQYELLSGGDRLNGIARIFLEKPLAENPGRAEMLCRAIEESPTRFFISYSFLYTDWGRALADKAEENIIIDWRFRAHHYSHQLKNWKRSVARGGGVLRFYGVHLIALAAFLEFNILQESTICQYDLDDWYSWEAVFVNKKGTTLRINVNADVDKEQFIIRYKTAGETIFSGNSPFDSLPASGGTDPRSQLLAGYLSNPFLYGSDYKRQIDLYKSICSLWNTVEAKSSYRIKCNNAAEYRNTDL